MNTTDPYMDRHFEREAVDQLLRENLAAEESRARRGFGPRTEEDVRRELQRMALYRLRGPVPNWTHAEHLSPGIVTWVATIAGVLRDEFLARRPYNRPAFRPGGRP